MDMAPLPHIILLYSNHTITVSYSSPLQLIIIMASDDTKEKYPVYYPPGGRFVIFNFHTGESPLEIIDKSAYCYFLFANIWTFAISFAIVGFQVVLFYFLWKDTKDIETKVFTGSTSREVAIMCASFVLALKVLPQLGQGLELALVGVKGFYGDDQDKKELGVLQSIKLVWVGVVIFAVAALCVWVGITASLKQSTVSDVITRATVATWIEGLDENMYTFIKHFSKPDWFTDAIGRLQKGYGPQPYVKNLTRKEIQDIRDLLNQRNGA